MLNYSTEDNLVAIQGYRQNLRAKTNAYYHALTRYLNVINKEDIIEGTLRILEGKEYFPLTIVEMPNQIEVEEPIEKLISDISYFINTPYAHVGYSYMKYLKHTPYMNLATMEIHEPTYATRIYDVVHPGMTIYLFVWNSPMGILRYPFIRINEDGKTYTRYARATDSLDDIHNPFNN